jgi:autotransporter-associated beta strand protein
LALALVIAVAWCQVAPAQTVFTRWNFNNYTQSATSPPIQPPNYGTGTGTASLVGGTNGAFFEIGGTTDPGSPDPNDPPTNQSRAWQVSNYPAQGAGSGTGGVQFLTSTVGRNNLLYTMDFRANNTASRWYQVQYTVDGSTWQNLRDPFEVAIGTGFANSTSFSFAGVAGTADADFGVRVVSVFAPGTSGYIGVVGGYSPAALTFFDMVTFAEGKAWTSAAGGSLNDGTSGANWSDGAVPASGTISSNWFFPGLASANVTATNNVVGFRAQSIAFTGASTAYTLAGDTLSIGPDGNGVGGLTTIINTSSRAQTFAAPLFVERRQTWDAGSTAGGSLVMNGAVTLLQGLNVTGANNTLINGAITGLGVPLSKSGTGELVLAGNNTGISSIAVNQGTLRVNNPSGGSANGGGPVTVAAGARLAGAQGMAAGTRGFIGEGTVMINGIVQPGTTATSTSAGQINFTGAVQGVTFNAGSRYVWDLAALADNATLGAAGVSFDQIRVENGAGMSLSNGAVELAFSGATTPNLANSFWQSGRTWTILQVTGSANTGQQFSGITNAAAFASVGTFTLGTAAGGSITLNYTPIPEPALILAYALGGGGLLYRLRRRFRS